MRYASLALVAEWNRCIVQPLSSREDPELPVLSAARAAAATLPEEATGQGERSYYLIVSPPSSSLCMPDSGALPAFP